VPFAFHLPGADVFAARRRGEAYVAAWQGIYASWDTCSVRLPSQPYRCCPQPIGRGRHAYLFLTLCWFTPFTLCLTHTNIAQDI